MSRVLVSCLILLAAILPATPAGAASCQFVLGLKALHDLIPATVGDCLTDEYHNPDNGDGLQQTTGGLLVWRKVDNGTAFTDRYRTWVNGPYGLRERLNTQRFSWEAPPAAPMPPPTPTPVPVPPVDCGTARVLTWARPPAFFTGVERVAVPGSFTAYCYPGFNGTDRTFYQYLWRYDGQTFSHAYTVTPDGVVVPVDKQTTDLEATIAARGY